MYQTQSQPQWTGDRRNTDRRGSPMMARLTDAPGHGEGIRHYGIPSQRVTAVRYLVPFAVAFVTWCAALLIAHHPIAHVGLTIGFGLALSDVLACFGVLAARWLDETGAARLRRVLTTTKQFPAIPVPDYLIAQIPPIYEPEIALRKPAHAADSWLPIPGLSGLQRAA